MHARMHAHTHVYLYNSSVGIVMGSGLDGQGLIPGRGKIFLFAIVSIPALGPTHPPVQWVLWAFSLGVKQRWHETDHLPPSNSENGGALPPLSHTSSWHGA
jgi:hypothetical protein